MKVTSEEDIDLNRFKAWAGGKDRLDVLVENGHWKDAQAFIEEVFPEGIDDGALNDWLWFEAEDQFPGWFFDDSEMTEIEEKVEELNKGEPRKPWFEADGGVAYYLDTDREDDDDPEHEPTLKLQAVAYGGNSGSVVSVIDIDYDFSSSFEDNLEALRKEMLENDVLPAIPSDMEYVESFPCWAATLMMYGDYSGQKRDDIYAAEVWQYENGYGDLSSLLEETHSDFDRHPAFGLACATETAVMNKLDTTVFLVVDSETDKYVFDDYGTPRSHPSDEPDCGLLVFWDEGRAKSWVEDMNKDNPGRYFCEKVFDPKEDSECTPQKS